MSKNEILVKTNQNVNQKRLRIWLNFILNGKLSFNYPKK